MSSAELSEADIEAVLDVLKSGRLALGPKAIEFEEEIAQYVGARHAVAVSSGTSALHIIVKALDFTRGDEVLVPSFTFASSVNVLLYEGISPVFVDIESDTCNICPGDLEAKITPRTKAMMVVDIFGHPVDWDKIEGVAAGHKLKIIDDSCEALGAEYGTKKTGQFGDAAAFAFYPNKQITTGEGGMIVTDDEEMSKLARSLRNQGRGEMGAWLEHERLGFNYRLDEMSAALGVSQLRRLEQFVNHRERVAELYTQRIRTLKDVEPPVVRPNVRKSWFVYVLKLKHGINRDAVIQFMAEKGIPSRAYFSPIHLQPYILARMPDRSSTLPVTMDVHQRTLALPFHNQLTEREIELVFQVLQEAIEVSKL